VDNGLKIGNMGYEFLRNDEITCICCKSKRTNKVSKLYLNLIKDFVMAFDAILVLIVYQTVGMHLVREGNV
jgi:hypothetical protein